jgi:hypothetical protein
MVETTTIKKYTKNAKKQFYVMGPIDNESP